MQITKSRIVGLAVSLVLFSGWVWADPVEVKSVVTKFEPMVVFVKPGDTVKWTNMIGHDTASIEGMIPEGATPWQSKMGEEFSITLDKEGAYVYKCTPHLGLGMAGAIVVGEGQPQNLEQIRKHPENKGMIGRVVRQLEQELKTRPSQK